MDPMISSYIAELSLGELQCFGNMAMVPLFTSVRSGLEYLTLKEALDVKLITITEIDRSGSVPELRVINPSDQWVLLVDGEELTGAKQNRILNTSVLLTGNTEAVIPVSCTEQGRWRYSSPEFSHSEHMLSSQLRCFNMSSVSASLHSHRGYSSDQHRIWSDIEGMHGMAGTSSPTGAMRDAYTAKSAELDEYIQAFEYVPGQRGSLFFINGQAVGLDMLSYEKAYKAVHPQLAKSYAMDALLLRKSRTEEQPSLARARDFLERAGKCEESRFKSIGRGYDHRFEGPEIRGSSLVSDECVIHITFISSEVSDSEEKPDLSHLKAVLWVDDEPENNREETDILTRGGTRVITATSSSEAMKKFESEKFDRIISDMGRMENGKYNEHAGIELIREIRKGDKDIPIIIYCRRFGDMNWLALGLEEEYGKPLAAGADGVTVSRRVLFEALGSTAKDKPRNVILPDGSRYAGPLKRGLPHGEGRMFFRNYEYAGHFKKGLPHGQGATILSDGTKTYEGQFRKGLHHGHGIKRSSDGTRYEGQFKDGVAHGQGRISYPNGHKYEGLFQRARPHGKGTWIFPDGSRYTGQFEHGTCGGRGIVTRADGKKYEGGGTVTFPDTEYEGQFENGMFHGQGILTHSHYFRYSVYFDLLDMVDVAENFNLFDSDEGSTVYGYKYEGQFRRGLPHGSGTVTFSHIMYEGQLKRGEPHGEAVITAADGTKYELRFRHGKVHGNVIKTYPKGHKYEGYKYQGRLRNGWPHGEGTWTLPDGSECTGLFKMGRSQRWTAIISPDGRKYEGEAKVTFPDGTKYTGQFRNGMFHGHGLIKYWNVAVQEQNDPYQDFDIDIDLDLFSSDEEECPKSRLESYEGQFRNGMPHGNGTETFSDGSEWTGQFKYRVPYGKGVWTLPDGTRYEGPFKHLCGHGRQALRV
ncbi:ARPP-1 family domain-containing protein [Desulfonema magnum]|uniref:Two component system response regulator domain-containing protein, MORN motif-containing n=1 Tax=Desulfonema magnum TaxID=45655 RepID=A0A975GUR3_9BACT|nr:DUF6569 family protein [Desulfonema magnum]QTA93163.1 Two component system response regulator domain-containing protein, MORN motif-containing [Desulfonema magnum]